MKISTEISVVLRLGSPVLSRASSRPGQVPKNTSGMYNYTWQISLKTYLKTRRFLDHFWVIFEPFLGPSLTGRTPFSNTQITACIAFSGSRFRAVFEQFLGSILGAKSPLENDISGVGNWRPKNGSKNESKMTPNGCQKCALLRCGSRGCKYSPSAVLAGHGTAPKMSPFNFWV